MDKRLYQYTHKVTKKFFLTRFHFSRRFWCYALQRYFRFVQPLTAKKSIQNLVCIVRVFVFLRMQPTKVGYSERYNLVKESTNIWRQGRRGCKCARTHADIQAHGELSVGAVYDFYLTDQTRSLCHYKDRGFSPAIDNFQRTV